MAHENFTPEQNERLSSALLLLRSHWGEMQNSVMSSKSIFGSFVNVAGPVDTLFSAVEAKLYVKSAVPQRRGGPADLTIAVGELPHGVHFSSKVRPALSEGQCNIDIELFPTTPDTESTPVLREVILGVCEELLGAELSDPEFLAYFVRRQFDRYNERRLRLVAEIARLVAEEVAHASTPRN